MYSGQNVQDLQLDDISSERRNPILADVMAQLDYMEKRGSGLKKICNETKNLKTYKEDRKPVFKSTATQFMTIIYSMEYEPSNQQNEQHGIKLGLSWDQAGTKLG
jgi:ATP-dependent DNA helicase RecG